MMLLERARVSGWPRPTRLNEIGVDVEVETKLFVKNKVRLESGSSTGKHAHTQVRLAYEKGKTSKKKLSAREQRELDEAAEKAL